MSAATTDRIAAAKAASAAAIVAARAAPKPHSAQNQPKAPRSQNRKPEYPDTVNPIMPAPLVSSAKTPKNGGTGQGKKRGNPKRAGRFENFEPAVLTIEQEERLAIILGQMSSRPMALAVLEPEVLTALRAMIGGASVPGPAGHPDRMSLFRLVGLPLAPGTGLGGGGKQDMVRALGQLGTRLERALSARDGRGGRDPVTVDMVDDPETPPLLTFPAVTHKMGDLVSEQATTAGVPDGAVSPDAAPSETPAGPEPTRIIVPDCL